jgi:hypothetical protein
MTDLLPPIVSLTTAPALVVTALLVAALLGTRYRLGPHADWVEVVRSACLPVLDPLIERLAGGVGSVYEIDESEVVTQVKVPERFEMALWQAGYRRNVMSAAKRLPDGTAQVSAWALRDPEIVGTAKQVDVQIFADGRVAAHHEPSSALSWLWVNPDVLRRHYRGVGYDPERGAAILRATVLDS